jgi:hypothetical protein
MRKYVYMLLCFIVPALSYSQSLFRSGTFLHHSTGSNIWGPNESSTSIPQQIDIYNATHGYIGTNAVSMIEQPWPETPWDNEWYRWHQIFENQDPYANITPVLTNNKIVVIKSCFPSSDMSGMGQPSDTLTYGIKSIYNYKWHWRHIVKVMAQHNNNFFVIWTNAPLTQGSSNLFSATLSKKFCGWAKDTLAQGLDPVIGPFPANIYVFDYFSKLVDGNGFEQMQYAAASDDSHPNALATELVSPQFVSEVFNAAIAYEQALQGKVLNLNLFLEGCYSGNGHMNPAQDESGVHWGDAIADKITVELHDMNNYSSILYSVGNVNLSTTGHASVIIPSSFSGSYYISIKHRNSLTTSSKNPVSFSSATINYNFDFPSKAYGNNMLLKPDGRCVIYSGDLNQDGLVDSGDLTGVDNGAATFATGYIAIDSNGDGLIDSGDMTIIDNNSSGFVSSMTP